MRRTIFFPLLLCAVLCGPVLSIARAGQTNEAQLIQILQSKKSSVSEKSDACAQLKRTGTEHSVKALAALLTDEQLSHSARYVLETMPAPQAGKALRRALGHTSGLLQVGIINSLAARHDSAAVGDLRKLLSSHDQTVAIASAEALGRIGGSAAVKALQASVAASTGPLHQAGCDALLTCASQLFETGNDSAALKLFEGLYNREKADQIRQAAFRGMMLTSGEHGLALALDAIANGDAPSRSAALHIASQLKGAEATKDFGDLAIGTPLPIQLALIECLVQRNDPAALPAVTDLAANADATVRLAATAALGSLGNDSSVRLLAEKAASTSGAERNTARQSLLELNRGPVTQRMLEMLNPASPRIKSELILALGGRGDPSATPALLDLARQGNDDERAAALQALGLLADASQIPAFVQMVADAGSDDLRSQTADALGAIYQRTPTARERDVAPLVKAVTSGSVETRVALLPICSELAQVSVRGALRAAVVDEDARIREAAIHALCDTHDPELLPDLLELAGGKGDDNTRHLAVRGCVHLTSQEEDVKFPNAKRLDALAQLLKGTVDAGEKRLVLSGLAGVADQRALALATGLLDDAEVQPEAEKAVLEISPLIRGAHAAKVRAALKKLLAETKNADNRHAAQDLLDKMK